MDDITRPPDLADGGHKKLFNDCIGLLSSVRSSLSDLLGQARAGDLGKVKDLTQKQSELEQALRRALETEQKFNEWQAKQRGNARPDDIDFETIRNTIGSRLDRLRNCCRT